MLHIDRLHVCRGSPVGRVAVWHTACRKEGLGLGRTPLRLVIRAASSGSNKNKASRSPQKQYRISSVGQSVLDTLVDVEAGWVLYLTSQSIRCEMRCISATRPQHPKI